MEFELRAAREKLEREQRERKDAARRKLERERKARADAIYHREALEAAQRARRLAAAQAELKAEQQRQECLHEGDGVMFCRTFQAVPFQGNGDKIKLPPSCFTELSDQGALEKGPMYFRVLTGQDVPSTSDLPDGEQTKGCTHAGVLEFTAAEGSVELPPHVWSNVFTDSIKNAAFAEVRYVRLPKGTYVKLQPDRVGFSDLPNYKAILETGLRQHATLSESDVITVNHGDLNYKLRVVEIRPASSVSVIETDIEVDILGADTTSCSVNHPVLVPLVLGKVESGTVEEGKYNYYKFSVESIVGDKIKSGDLSLSVRVEVESDGDADLYVSRHPILFPTLHQHEWSSHDVGTKVLILNCKDEAQLAGLYSIGLYGFKGLAKYKVIVSLEDRNAANLKGQTVSSTSSPDPDLVQCNNCKNFIPNRTIALHQAYCSRHNVKCQFDGCGVILRKEEVANHVHCEKCGQAFQQKEMDKHMKVYHVPLYCSCGVVLEKEEMVRHQSSECPLRLVTCRFCGDMLPAGTSASNARDRLRGLSEHESMCGSRTARCDSCGRSVMLKEMDVHNIAVHQKS